MSMDNILLGALGVLLFFTYRNNKQVVENFLNVPLQSKVERVKIYPSGKKETVPQSQMFMVPSNYQATIPPRQASVGYGAYTRYAPPASAMRGESMGTLNKGGRTVIAEGFENGANKLPSYSNGVVQTEKESAPVVEQQVEGDVNAIGQVEPQPIIQDRMYYANAKSLKTKDSDFIRGDLPIPPNNWEVGRPSSNPSTDLRPGILDQLGDADTNSALASLRQASKGAPNPASSLSSTNYSTQKLSMMSGGGGDAVVKVTSFP